MQSKRSSLVESIVNTAVGFLTSLILQVIIFPIFGVHLSANEHVVMTIIFTVVSIVRGYAVRRIFESLKEPVSSTD